MKQIMVVETRDPLATPDVESLAQLVTDLQHQGVHCAMLLAENGVLGARRSAAAQVLPGVAGKGVELFADRFALAERGIAEDELAESIIPAEIGIVVDRLVSGASVIWR